VTLYRSYREALRTGLLVCTFTAFSVPAFSTETNSSTNVASRARDDRSAAVTLALQAVQQLQTEQRATLQAVEEARQQSELAARRVESLRYLIFALCAIITVGVIGTAYYVSSLVRKLRDREQLPVPFNSLLPAAARAPDSALHVATLLARGQALLEQRHPVDALTCFEQAIAIDNHATSAFIKKGAALGRLDEALTSYERALKLDDSHADAYIGKGNVLNRLERYQEALACFEQAAQHQHSLHTLPHTVSATP
jgi:tetratricopeptide (TPR) repeat protein